MASDPHESAVKHVCGSAPYIDDFVDSGYRHIAIGGSSIACGNITSMDLTDVASSEGVVDVITVADIPGHYDCLLYTSPSPRDATLSRMPSSA